MGSRSVRTRHLVLVLGDQLDPRSSAFDGFDPASDAVWMAEVAAESTHVPSHVQRTALFLAAMRHFRDDLRAAGRRVDYVALDDPVNAGTLDGELERAVRRLRPARLVATWPGEWRVKRDFERVTSRLGVELEWREDRHFLCAIEEFAAHARGRRLRLETFYRAMRRRHAVLMEGARPAGGRWNYDPENRAGFGKAGPAEVPEPLRFAPDPVTREVIELVRRRFPAHPGSLDGFEWPVTRSQALAALEDFVRHRLPGFGPHQDAMWTGETTLWHSRLSSSLNLKLIDPREVIAAAERAWREGHAPLASVEGFVRQVLGWREFVRGTYWTQMPAYLELNALGADRELPGFYWTGETDMACVGETVRQTLARGYAHHIQRLMVTGLHTLLLGVHPRAVHAWYLGVYVDAVEWVELPNVLGMSQYADGGVMASKPYVASGNYVRRMSDYCARCRFDPARAVGEEACPLTTLYWDFLARHRARLATNSRMAMQLRNLARLDPATRAAIAERARAVRDAQAPRRWVDEAEDAGPAAAPARPRRAASAERPARARRRAPAR